MADLTTQQAADRLGVAQSTITLWCRQKRFPGAYRQDTPRGAIWWIPERDLQDFEPPRMGRPRKISGRSTAPKRHAPKGRREKR